MMKNHIQIEASREYKMINDNHIKTRKINWIESLRGVACIAVIIQHYFGTKFYYFNIGNFGVILFFILSGYIVTIATVIKKTETPASFIILRIGRLYPAYLISIIICLIIGNTELVNVIKNLTMIPEFLHGKSLIGVYWTLHVEWVFYLMVAMLLFFKKFNGNGIKILFILFAALSCALGLVRYELDIKAPVAMAIGVSTILISSIISIETKKTEKVKFSAAYILFVCLIPAITSYSKDWGHDENPFEFITSDIAAISLFLVFYKYKISDKITRFFGKISYSIYLLHLLVIKVVEEIIEDRNVTIFSSITITIALSWIVFTFIEKPINSKVRKYVSDVFYKDK